MARPSLALLWQIYSGRRSLQIHFRQCGHRCGGSRAKSSTMAWRTAGKGGGGGGPVVFFFPALRLGAGVGGGGVNGHRSKSLTGEGLPGSCLRRSKANMFFSLAVALLGN